MKTNVSIKFNSIEEFQEAEQKLIELGYTLLNNHIDENQKYFYIDYKYTVSTSNIIQGGYYNSLEEFLKD